MNGRSTKGSIMKLSFLLLSCLSFSQAPLGVTVRAVQNAAPTRQIVFNRDIRPILADKCWGCHGPDAPAKKIKLRLDSEDAATADLGGGRHAIVPGNPEQSQLVRRITSGDEMTRMPPVYTGRKLTQTEIDLLVEWVRQGARWQRHWSFVTPIRPLLPQIKNKEWPKNAIDHFVLERLEREGMEPSPEADRATLIRRVSLDLTGLPPAPREVEDFLNDKSPNAYEKVVDRLLASPRYGERMAFRWLDAARYADTNGYQIDGDRSAWRWRDWVIDAFNQNKPFDQFVVEQLAGDLLPNATLDQKIATAFNRNHRINAEGGVVPEEYRVEYVVDRVDTTSTVFMGLTLGCARCHNHKYDPFTQKEYYQLTAYFNSIDEDGHSFDQGNSPPVMAAPTKEQRRRLRQFTQEIARAESHYNALAKKSARAQRGWEKSLLASNDANQQWFPDDKLIARLPLDAQSAPVFKKSDRAHHDQYDGRKDGPEQKFEIGFREGSPRYVESPTGQGVAFDGKLYFDAGIHADFRYKSTSKDYRERFTIATWIYPESEQSGSIITKVSDGPAEVENNVPRAEGYGLYFIDGKIHFNMVFRWGEDALRVETEEPLPPRQWRHIAVVFDGLKSWEDRLRIFVDGREAKLKFNQRNFFLLFGGTRNTLKIGGGGGPQFRFKGAIDEVRIYSRALDADEIAALACADSLEKIAAIPAANRARAQALKIHGAFLAQAAPDELKQARDTLVELKRQKQNFEDELPSLMIMKETAQPRPAFLLKRGAYDAPGEKVERGVPATLPPLLSGDLGEAARIAPMSNRLDFARWLVSAEHPLTSRVAVNRFWQMLFGVGLVRTTEDFGTQGELPSHPELLDWLAVEFRDGATGRRGGGAKNPQSPSRAGRNPRWDVKALLKTIVMSATYRQSSKITPQSQQRDPDNRLLARGPRFRLPAEMIRDQALFVSGLLVEKLGGPSVKPYQPDGLYKDMAFSGLTGYEHDEGEGLWRRSLYTFWKRTVLSPTMQVFDASAREYCTVRDTRTNTPLQSLNLMNDVTYVEAARLLAQRMLLEGGATPQSRVTWAFLVAASRRPGERELQVLLRNLSRQTDYFGHNPQEATRLLSIGEKRNDANLDAVELAAYAATASLILNLDEVITKQ
jgi:mono/diheme cytochrome c family protein